MNAADEYCAAQQVNVCVGEDALHFVHVLFGEAKFFQCLQRLLDVQHQPKLANADGRVIELDFKWCGVFGDFLKVVKASLEKIILDDWKELVFAIYTVN